MKNFVTSLLLLLVIAAPVFSQTEAQQATGNAAPAVAENSLLWRISGNGLAAPSYLYGTIHMIAKDDFFLTDSTRAFIDRAGQVTFEIDMEDMNNIATQLSLLMDAMMDGGQTLHDLLSEEDYKIVKTHFDKMGLPLMFLERMKPMFLTVFTGMDMSPQAMSSGEMVSYEMEIMKIAQEQNKEIGGLETAQYQMSMFDSIPYQAQANMLVESIKSANAGEEEFAKMVELYKKQDIAGMTTMMGQDDGIGEYEDLLLVQRNKNWIPVMGEMMAERPTFFAVGAGHLGGKTGVVALLRKEGYAVAPVR
ncbi:MAG: TraB/GumN family protein [Saprospiraceae bacterium]|nr:MAG: TraB/GumN family protein [Saprospiraceae bacterium]